MEGYEIERKWLINRPIKDYKDCKLLEVFIDDSFYICTDPDIRYRKHTTIYPFMNTEFIKTYKSNGDMVRKEINETISSGEYFSMMLYVCNVVNSKTTILLYHDGHVIFLAVVDNNLVYAEVEFENEDEAKAYEFPFTDGVVEVTDQDWFKMKNHYLRTLSSKKAALPSPFSPGVAEEIALAKEKLANVKE